MLIIKVTGAVFVNSVDYSVATVYWEITNCNDDVLLQMKMEFPKFT